MPYDSRSRIAALLVFGVLKTAPVFAGPSFELLDAHANEPFTIGYVFKPGEFKPSAILEGVAGKGAPIPLQVDVKATHADGSIRHAILTGFVPDKIPPRARFSITATDTGAAGAALNDEMLKSLQAKIVLSQGGKTWSLSLQQALANGMQPWLHGPLVSEWISGGSLLDEAGKSNPYLAGYFHVRVYRGQLYVRIDTVLENDWTFVQEAKNLTYDVDLHLNGKSVYQQNELTHFRHARWHKTFWLNQTPSVQAVHDIDYLQSTGAVPRYMSLQPPEQTLSLLMTKVEPMSNGPVPDYMASTGASPAIGPLPRWAALYVVSGDPGAKQATLTGGDAGGTYSVHYRDRKTGLPVSIAEYPTLSWNGETLPKETGGNKYSHDQAHQPSIAYLPYLLSGDYFYLEELQFWANWNMLWSHHEYRQREKGIIGVQVRGQAWALREIGRTAYITPDNHPLKKYFVDRIHFNIDYNTKLYADNPNANKLGALKSYDGHENFAPWMDDFYTWTMGHLVELGFDDAKAMRNWKARFPVGRMGNGDNGYCYVHAAAYHLLVGPAKNRWWPDFATLYAKNFPNEPAKPCPDGREMTGYPDSPTGFPSNLRPALAIAVDAGSPGAVAAWQRLLTSVPQPDYNDYPNFALVPRVPVK
jgi:hypothetical protein